MVKFLKLSDKNKYYKFLKQWSSKCGNFIPQGLFGSFWRHFWLSQLGRWGGGSGIHI